MKLTKSQLRQIIKEEYAGQEYDEGHAASYNYGDTKPRSDDPEYLKGFEAGLRQKAEEKGEDYFSTYTAPVDVDYDPMKRTPPSDLRRKGLRKERNERRREDRSKHLEE